jgi:hypothetical protein
MTDEHNWIPERVKNWIVIITMTMLVGGFGWGYYAMYQWKAEREAEKRWVEQTEQMERLMEAEREAAKEE